MNYDWWDLTSNHQKLLDPLREVTHDALTIQGWVQLVHGYTRVQKFRGNTSLQRSCLDHVYCKSAKNINRVVNRNILSHDHNCVGLHLATSTSSVQPQVSKKRDIKNLNIQDFATVYFSLFPEEMYTAPGVNEMLEIFVHKITLALDVLTPIKRVVVSSKNRAVWLSEEIKESIARRQSQRKKAARSGLEQDWIQFRRLRNETTAKVRKEKMKYMADQLKPDQDPKNLWSNLKKLSKVSLSSNATIAIVHNDEVIKLPKILSDLFNDFFIKKVEKIVKICPPPTSTMH